VTITSSNKRGWIVILAAALVLLGVGSAGATGRYADPAGDAGSGPDITSVTVAGDPSGLLTFSITLASSVANAMALLALDTDANPATGAGNGAEYVFLVDQTQNTYDFARWTGSDWDTDTPSSTAGVRNFGSRIDIRVNRSELGDPAMLNLAAATFAGDAVADVAPDKGQWSYSLAAGGPDLQTVQTRATPARPKAGKPFTIAATAVMLPPGVEPAAGATPDSYTCRATLRGKAIPGTGVGGCSWKLPKTARGATLAVAVTVNYQGASKSVPLTYRVS
jgi:hypothetical protein